MAIDKAMLKTINFRNTEDEDENCMNCIFFDGIQCLSLGNNVEVDRTTVCGLFKVKSS